MNAPDLDSVLRRMLAAVLEIIAFVAGGALSKSRGGHPVALAEVLQRAGWPGAF